MNTITPQVRPSARLIQAEGLVTNRTMQKNLKKNFYINLREEQALRYYKHLYLPSTIGPKHLNNIIKLWKMNTE